MEKFYLEKPSIDRKEEAIEYINEFILFESHIAGTGALNKYLKKQTYEKWLEKINNDEYIIQDKNNVPMVTYFMIRCYDNKIVGMCNIRLSLNDKYEEYMGNISYSIRPTERKKGYGKINLYLALLKCREQNIDKVLLGCKKENIPSLKTIEALSGNKIKEFKYKENIVQKYYIDVNEAIEKHKNIYNNNIEIEQNKRKQL